VAGGVRSSTRLQGKKKRLVAWCGGVVVWWCGGAVCCDVL
jgi:hypothetical protein